MTAPAVIANQKWKRLCVFLCYESKSKATKKGRRSFSFLFSEQFGSMFSHQFLYTACLRTCPRRSRLVGFFGFIFLPSKGSSSSSSPISTSARVLQLVRCHHLLVLHLDSEFSLDLRAHCSAILVSRLLTVLRKTMISIFHMVGPC